MKINIAVYCHTCNSEEGSEGQLMTGNEKMYVNEHGTQARLYTCPVCSKSVTVTLDWMRS